MPSAEKALSVFITLLDEFFLSYELTSYASDVRVEKHNAPFAFSYEKLNERLGTSYSKEEIKQVLDAYRIEEKDGMLYPPLDRVDLLEQCDIEEEVFRYYPADKVNPTSGCLKLRAEIGTHDQTPPYRERI